MGNKLRKIFLLSLGLLLLSTPSFQQASRQEIKISYVQKKEVASSSSSASSSQGDSASSSSFDMTTLLTSTTGLVLLGGAGAGVGVFWSKKRGKLDNEPAKTVEKEEDEEK